MVIKSLLNNQIKCGTIKTIKISKDNKYLKSNFLCFLIKIKYKKIKVMEANKYKNKYFDKKPKPANNPNNKQSLKHNFFLS